MTNCRNQTGVPGINMHYFSKEKTLPLVIWVNSLSNRARRTTGKGPCCHLRSLRLLARVGIKLNNQNNSNICHLFQRTLIDELSFYSESVNDFLAARHFPAEFQLYHDRATRQYSSPRHFTSVHPSKSSFLVHDVDK